MATENYWESVSYREFQRLLSDKKIDEIVSREGEFIEYVVNSLFRHPDSPSWSENLYLLKRMKAGEARLLSAVVADNDSSNLVLALLFFYRDNTIPDSVQQLARSKTLAHIEKACITPYVLGLIGSYIPLPEAIAPLLKFLDLSPVSNGMFFVDDLDFLRALVALGRIGYKTDTTSAIPSLLTVLDSGHSGEAKTHAEGALFRAVLGPGSEETRMARSFSSLQKVRARVDKILLELQSTETDPRLANQLKKAFASYYKASIHYINGNKGVVQLGHKLDRKKFIPPNGSTPKSRLARAFA